MAFLRTVKVQKAEDDIWVFLSPKTVDGDPELCAAVGSLGDHYEPFCIFVLIFGTLVFSWIFGCPFLLFG